MTNCADVTNRFWAAGNEEQLEYQVVSNEVLENQPVAVTFDRVTLLPASWTGNPGTTRSLITDAPVTDADFPPDAQAFEVFVDVLADSGEHILHVAETITII